MQRASAGGHDVGQAAQRNTRNRDLVILRSACPPRLHVASKINLHKSEACLCFTAAVWYDGVGVR